MHAPLVLLHPVISIGPFAKWGIDFVTCNPVSSARHNYIIVVVDYFMKWAEALPTYWDNGEIATLFLFNQVICHFVVTCMIVTDHSSHFQNHMMSDLTSLLSFRQENSSSCYPQANDQEKVFNNVLKTMIFRLVGNHKTHWNFMLYPALWAYQTLAKTATGFTPFQLYYDLDIVLSIEFQIPSLKLVVELLPCTNAEEERFLSFNQRDETR